MALARCASCGKPNGRKHKYVAKRLPLNFPDSAVMCGNCGTRKAIIWLDSEERKEYLDGKRVFDFHTASVKVMVK